MPAGSGIAFRQRGTTFVAVLVLLAICVLGLGIAGPLWSQQVKRAKEQELLRVGAMYARAIAGYHDASPGTLKQYPLKLDALLLDTRYVGVARYIRKAYGDPVNPGQAWGLIQDTEGRVVGVFSRSEGAPVAEGPLNLGDVLLAPAKRYSDWKFMAKVKS